ncbi:restriction endonuclease subunit S [Maribacter sp. 2-571]|uniref:restriction endonuclease subunit S n=1 Tax=Maribacter sp. 2-571 TaxID=3417569 RepID=UPI003D33446C
MSNWSTIEIKEGLKEIIDYRGFTPPKSDSGIPLISAANVKNGKLDFAKSSYISNENYKKYGTRGFISPGDLIITTEAPAGEVAILPDDQLYQLSRRVMALRTDEEKLHNKFLYYTLLNSRVKAELLLANRGTTVPRVLKTDITEFKISIPKIEEQKAIALVLSLMDDKIDLLKLQNKTLEQTAQTIFKEWFGKYQIGDELPNEWQIFGMNELLETINGYSYKGKELVAESDEALVTLKSFDRNGGFQTRGFKPFNGTPKETQEVQIGDLVVAHTDLTQDAEVLGNPAFVFDNGGFDKMFITMDLVKVNSTHKDVSSSFLYYLMKDRRFKGHCIGYSNGTTVLHLSKKAIPEYQLPLPIDFKKVKEFSAIANSTTNKISLNKDIIKNLAETRNTLLPKLMSGKLRVNEFKD